MSIQVFPEPSSDYLQFGGYLTGGYYGTPSDATNITSYVINQTFPAGVYRLTVDIVVTNWDSIEVGVTSRGLSQGTNILGFSTGASSYKYNTRAEWQSFSGIGITTTFRGIAYGNGYYIVTTQNGSAVSTNGINWSTISLLVSGAPQNNQRAVSYANGFFIVNGPNDNGTNIFISTDGVNWASRLVATSCTPFGRWAYSSAQGLYWNHYLNGGIIISSNMSTFTTRATIVGSGNGASSYVFYNNPWWIKADNNGMLISTNGTTWTTRDPMPGFGITGFTYGNNRYVATFNSAAMSAVSTDLVNWTTASLPWSSATNQSDLIFGNGYFLSAGPGLNNNTYSGLFSSTDGLNWVARWAGSNNEASYMVWGSSGSYVQMRGVTGTPGGRQSNDIAGKVNGTLRFFIESARSDIN